MENMGIEESANTKFLGLQIDNHLNWKNHIDQMIPKWGHVMQLDQCIILSILAHLNQSTLPTFTL
jgi:hypothetical protein